MSQKTSFVFPKDLTLSGRVINPDDNTLINDDFLVTITDSKRIERKAVADKGIFRFTDLYYEGPFSLSLRLDETRRIREPIQVFVDLNSFDPIDYRINMHTKPLNITATGPNWRNPYPWYKRIFSKSSSDSNIKRPDSKLNPSQTIYLEDVPITYHGNMMQLLRSYVRGMYVNDYGVIVLRTSGRRSAMTDPLFLVDGLLVDKNYFLSLNISTVERIDVFKGASASIFGSRGANGAIAAYTQRSHFLSAAVIDFSLEGYHIAKEFNPNSALNKSGELIPCKTVYFLPYLEVKNQNEIKVKIPGKFPTGEYLLIIQGIDECGQPGYARAVFNIE